MPADIDAEQMEAFPAVATAIKQFHALFFAAGSFAGNAYGFYRITADVDLATDLKTCHDYPMVEALIGRFHVSNDAVRRR